MNYKIDTTSLGFCPKAFSYYKQNFAFASVQLVDEIENSIIPIYKEALNLHQDDLEWLKQYVKVFIDVYNKTLMPTQTDNQKDWLLRFIATTDYINMNEINYLASHTAKAVKAWEIIISDLPYYQNTIFKEPGEKQPDHFETSNIKECLIDIRSYLVKQNLLTAEEPVWLAWFGYDGTKSLMTWKGTPTMLANLLRKICGCENVPITLKAFGIKVGSPDSINKFNKSKVGIDIESKMKKYK